MAEETKKSSEICMLFEMLEIKEEIEFVKTIMFINTVLLAAQAFLMMIK